MKYDTPAKQSVEKRGPEYTLSEWIFRTAHRIRFFLQAPPTTLRHVLPGIGEDLSNDSQDRR